MAIDVKTLLSTAAPIGFTGSAGSVGYTGSSGAYAAVGYTGSAGSVGYTGSQGAGFTGSRGDTGFTGSVAPGALFSWKGARRLFNSTLSTANWDRVPLSSAEIDTDSFSNAQDGFTIPAGVSKIRVYFAAERSINTGTVTGNAWRVYKNGNPLSSLFAESEINTGFSDNAVSFVYNVIDVVEGDVIDLRYFIAGSATWVGFLEIEVVEGLILGSFVGGIGFTGSEGMQGYTGSTGYTGSSGAYAAVGFTGSKGDAAPITSQAVAMAIIFSGY